MYSDLELRKLPTGCLSKIVDILDINEDWKRVMSIIPKEPLSITSSPLYNSEHIRLIENHSATSGRKCTEILLEEWGTSGKVRPTLRTLKEIVLKCQIYRAADEIAIILNEPSPNRPMNGPAAAINTDVSILLNDMSIEQKLDEMDTIKDLSNITLDTHYNNIIAGNRTTAQMKSATDLIQFSDSNKFPNLSAFTPIDKQTTAQMKDSELVNIIQYSEKCSNVPNECANTLNSTPLSANNVNESGILQSANIPDLSALISYSEHSKNPQNSYKSETSTISQSSTISSDIHSIQDYQTSFPNIEMSQPLNEKQIDDSILQDSNLINFKYQQLQVLTNNFAEQISIGPRGIVGKIGFGGFGEVFVGEHSILGALAVKKAYDRVPRDCKPDMMMRIFNAEVKFLSQFRHENIVPILGFSIDGPAPCVVCEFIDGGSLERKISAKVLNIDQRANIMVGTAEGLKYLHCSLSYDGPQTKKNNFVHGDVKSANILITKDCIPKLCDFGLAKQYDTTFVTTSPMGTSAYMAPEGFSGTITQKIDIYSFGIVLLEILTGLKSIVEKDKEKINIRDYIKENIENDDFSKFLDNPIKDWEMAQEVYVVAKSCLKRDRRKRPAIEDICEKLNSIKNK